MLAGTAVFAVGIALAIPSILALAMLRAPASERGSVMGTTSVFLDLSFGIAPVALTPLAEAGGYGAAFIASGRRRGAGRRAGGGRRARTPALDRAAGRRRSRLGAMAIERVFVAGAGLMGHGIAQVHAAAGKRVALYEPDLARATAGRDRIAGNLERAVAKSRLHAADRDAILARLTATDDLAAAADADLVVEAVFEDVDVKTRALGRRSTAIAPAAAIFGIEHVVDRHRPPGGRGGGGAARPVRRRPLLQPRAR